MFPSACRRENASEFLNGAVSVLKKTSLPLSLLKHVQYLFRHDFDFASLSYQMNTNIVKFIEDRQIKFLCKFLFSEINV